MRISWAVSFAALVMFAFTSLPAQAGGGDGSGRRPERGAAPTFDANKCRVLLGLWREKDDSRHRRKMLSKMKRIEKRMRRHGCPPPHH